MAHLRKPNSRKLAKVDGERGDNSIDGCWISWKDAKELAGDEEWWKYKNSKSRAVEEKQYDPNGPKDKPVWLFENGDMYLGPWTSYKGKVLEHGFGITYNHNPPETCEGLMCLGEFKQGFLVGKAESFWTESSDIWERNYLKKSPIKQQSNGRKRSIGVPFRYTGKFNRSKNDPKALVILKDDTKRIGPWKNGKPVGNWWKDHKDPDEDDSEDEDGSDEELAGTIARSRRRSPRSERGNKKRQIPSKKDTKRKSKDKYSDSSDDETSDDEPVKATQRASTNITRRRFARYAKSGDNENSDNSDEEYSDVERVQRTARARSTSSTAQKDRKRQRSVKRSAERYTRRRRDEEAEESEEEMEDDRARTGAIQAQDLSMASSARSSAQPRNETSNDEPDEVELALRSWLKNTIKLLRDEDINKYAKEVINLGLDSPKHILEHCTEEDINDSDDFAWMKPFHKRALIERSGLKVRRVAVKEETTEE